MRASFVPGVQRGEKNINNIRFADDSLASRYRQPQNVIIEDRHCMKIKLKKTNGMVVSKDKEEQWNILNGEKNE